MTAELLQVGFLVGSVLVVSLWAGKKPRQRHPDGCGVCSLRERGGQG